MGYRSDVIIVITKYARTLALIENNFPSLLAKTTPISEDDADVIAWSFENVKWYEGYIEVDEVMTYLDTLFHNDGLPKLHGMADHYGFMRIGEDDTDIAYKGEPYIYGITLNRSVRYEDNDVLDIVAAIEVSSSVADSFVPIEKYQ
jgi:hypothetical protein